MVGSIFLRCISGPVKGEVFELHSMYRYVLGREQREADSESLFIELNSKNVSRQHAEIFFEADAWQIRDLKSFNGIRLDRMKVTEAFLHQGAVIDIAEFSFQVEFAGQEEDSQENSDPEGQSETFSPPNDSSQIETPKTGEAAGDRKNLVKVLSERIQKIDFRFKLLIIFIGLGIASFFITKLPIVMQIEKDLLRQSYRYGKQLAKTLGDRNREALSMEESFRLDCDIFRDNREVVSAVLWDRLGKQVCREGKAKQPDELLQWTMKQQEFYSTCDSDLGLENLQACSSAYPVKKWIEAEGKMMTVGFAQVDFYPQEAVEQIENLNSLLNRVFYIVMVFFIAAWFLVYLWMKRGVKSLEEDVHLLFTGATQKVESSEAFAVFEPLVQEVNRLFIKLNQNLSSQGSGEASEAGFLQDILQQIFMLEER
ncbi:MAG: FHA domain-containing protein, partial [Bdellovibrionota bacterium]